MSIHGFGGLIRRFLTTLGALAAIVAVSACATRGGPVPYDPVDFKAPDVETISPSRSQQLIGPLDKLRIVVFQVEDLSGEFQVDALGKVQFPLIGEVEAQGLLPGQLSQRIAERLSERYMQSPNVQVAIVEQSQHTITVDGSVQEPGVVPIRGTTTLMRAIALAKGMTADANPARVVVFRTVNGERMAGAFDMRAIRRAESEDPVIYGNDIIVVDGQRARSIWREVIGTLPVLGIFTAIIP